MIIRLTAKDIKISHTISGSDSHYDIRFMDDNDNWITISMSEINYLKWFGPNKNME